MLGRSDMSGFRRPRPCSTRMRGAWGGATFKRNRFRPFYDTHRALPAQLTHRTLSEFVQSVNSFAKPRQAQRCKREHLPQRNGTLSLAVFAGTQRQARPSQPNLMNTRNRPGQKKRCQKSRRARGVLPYPLCSAKTKNAKNSYFKTCALHHGSVIKRSAHRTLL
ncbi:unnamed protein product [Ectocarpus sp. 6 AP-2014]